MTKLSALALTALTLLSGCGGSETTTSDNVATPGIWAAINITADGVGADIDVELNVGGSNGTNLELSDGDELRVTSGNRSVTLQVDNDFLDVDYEGYLQESGSDALFQVAFRRRTGTSALSSTVRLPEAMDISFPQAFMDFGFDALPEIRWLPIVPGGTMEITESLRCTTSTGESSSNSVTNNTPDDGRYQSQILIPDSADRTRGCTMSIRLERLRQGTLDPAFEAGGYIRAFQVREVGDIQISL